MAKTHNSIRSSDLCRMKKHYINKNKYAATASMSIIACTASLPTRLTYMQNMNRRVYDEILQIIEWIEWVYELIRYPELTNCTVQKVTCAPQLLVDMNINCWQWCVSSTRIIIVHVWASNIQTNTLLPPRPMCCCQLLCACNSVNRIYIINNIELKSRIRLKIHRHKLILRA